MSDMEEMGFDVTLYSEDDEPIDEINNVSVQYLGQRVAELYAKALPGQTVVVVGSVQKPYDEEV